MSLLRRLYTGDHDWDFLGWSRRLLVASAVLVVLSIGSLGLRGLNLGIDFEGGVVWEVPAGDTSVAAARDALRPLGLAEARVQQLRGSDTERLRVQAGPRDAEARQEVTEALAEVTGAEVADVSVNEVGPSWGEEITRSAVRALIAFFLLVALYISLRFEWKMAAAALVAVVHDIVISVGIYSLLGLEVTPATVISFLTILGYSLYDTIVVFDKVRENGRLVGPTGATYGGMVNRSLNQVLMRSVNTTVAALLPILAILVVGAVLLGAVTLQEFGLALLVGMAVGAYSSVFVAAPVLTFLKEREPRYAAIRQRVEQRGGPGAGRVASPTVAPPTTGGPGGRRSAATGRGPLRPGAGAAARTAAGPGPRPEGDAGPVAVDDAEGAPTAAGPRTGPSTAGPPRSPVPSRAGQPPRGRKKGRRR